jgi:hypothetical protein
LSRNAHDEGPGNEKLQIGLSGTIVRNPIDFKRSAAFTGLAQLCCSRDSFHTFFKIPYIELISIRKD